MTERQRREHAAMSLVISTAAAAAEATTTSTIDAPDAPGAAPLLVRLLVVAQGIPRKNIGAALRALLLLAPEARHAASSRKLGATAAAETADAQWDARSLVDVFESAHVTAGFSFVVASTIRFDADDLAFAVVAARGSLAESII